MFDKFLKLSESEDFLTVCLDNGIPFSIDCRNDSIKFDGSIATAKVWEQAMPGHIGGNSEITFDSQRINYIQTFKKR